MKNRFFSIILSLILIVSFIPTAFAADDTTKPVLTGVTLDKSEYNLGDTITVTAQAVETESKLDPTKCYAYFVGSTGCTFTVALNALVNGGIQGSATLKELEAANYRLEEVYLIDNNDNESICAHCYYNLPELDFKLNSDYKKPPVPVADPDRPFITAYSLSRKTAHVGDTVIITISAKQASGIATISMQLLPQWIAWFDMNPYDIHLSPVDNKPGTFTGTFTVTADTPESPYYDPFNVVVTSNSGKTSIDNLAPGVQFQSLNVVNPNHKYIEPLITSYSMSGHSFVQGQSLTLTMSVNDGCDSIIRLLVFAFNMDTDEYTSVYFQLFRQADGRFSGTSPIPITMKKGNYALCGVDGFIQNGEGGGVGVEDYLLSYINNEKFENLPYIKGSNFTVSPALTVSGTDNESLLQGSSFDAMAGVSANNYYTGDITDKIAVTGGDFDTNIPGLYLVKYKITDTVPFNGTDYNVTYTDYRWIGVTKVSPDSPDDAPLSVTNGNIVIGASSSDASIKKDGKPISYSDTLTDPGKYTLSCGGSSGSVSAASSSGVHALSISNSNSVTAVIDKTGPSIKTEWLKNKKSGMIDVLVKPGDVSGTAEIRYMQGNQSIDTCRGGGAVTNGKFSVPGYGKYTVYTRDNLGNEAVSVLNINKPSYGTAYLDGVKLSDGSLTKAFSCTTYSYNIKLTENQDSVTISPVKLFDAEGMTIGGQAADYKTVTVENGKSTSVKVKVTLGGSTKTYTFTITRAKSTDATLQSLSASIGTFDVTFDPAWNVYKLSLDKSTSSVTVTANVNEQHAKASISSKTYTLKPGQTITVKIKVKAQSGATNYYIVKITRLTQ